MKNILFLLFISTYTFSFSQKLTTCLQCSTTKYSKSDITENKLYELQILRNEIFARHSYQFKNNRLGEYFSQFNWYNNLNLTKIVNLNTIEKHNVTLFKQKEEIIKNNRKLLIIELKKLKKAVMNNDNNFINTVFKSFISKQNNYYPHNELISALKSVFESVNLDFINWHKGKAKYSIEIDNGFSISSKAIHISKNSITIIVTDPQSNSSLMKNDAFQYPSDYFSEAENSAGGVFEFKNGKLTLTNLMFAG